MMVTMTTDASGRDTVHPVHANGASIAPDPAPVHPVQTPLPGAIQPPDGRNPVQLRTASPGQVAPEPASPVQPDTAPASAPPVQPPRHRARLGALGRRLRGALPVHRGTAPGAPVHHPVDPGSAPGALPVRLTAAAPRPVRAAPKRRTDSGQTLQQQWGRLTEDRSRGTVLALRILAVLIVVSLVGVVVAPPILSAVEILTWAKSNSPESGLGLSNVLAWLSFLALDFAAAVCVLICVYCAIVNVKPGIFAWYVWAFAGATAYANHSFGSRAGAPGDADWFFPLMSLLGPLLLHSVLGFVRNRIKGAQGNRRGQRPSFPLADWLPVWGTPQDTYGAWRTGAMLGIGVPDAALLAYRLVSLEAGWCSRWFVKRLVRTHQNDAFRARLADPTLALAVPGLVPDGAFVSTAPVHQGDLVHDQGSAPGQGGAPPVHHLSPGAAAPPLHHLAPAGAPTSGEPAPDAPCAPGAPVHTDVPGATGGTVVNLNAAARESARVALVRIYAKFGASRSSWGQLIEEISLHKIETQAGVGKRRAAKALPHAETILPWAEAPAAAQQEASA